MPMIAAVLIYKLKPYLTAPLLAVAAIVIIPSADGVANAFAAWPVIVALNTNVGYVGTWIASFITLGLAAFVVWIIALVVARPAAAAVAAPLQTPTPMPVERPAVVA
jgi:hypothetical protein